MAAVQGLDGSAALQFAVPDGTVATVGLRRNWSMSIDQSTIDTTAADNDGWSSHIKGTKSGSMEVSCVYDKADPVQDILRTALIASTAVDVKANVDGDTYAADDCLVSNVSIDASHDDVVQINFSVALNKVTYTAA